MLISCTYALFPLYLPDNRLQTPFRMHHLKVVFKIDMSSIMAKRSHRETLKDFLNQVSTVSIIYYRFLHANFIRETDLVIVIIII